MARAVLNPRPFYGHITAPLSKSWLHRALISLFLAGKQAARAYAQANDDTIATAQALLQLAGALEKTAVIDCGASASTLRFLIPLAARQNRIVLFTGQARLFERPLEPYQKIFNRQKLLFRLQGNTLKLQGPLQPGRFVLDGKTSSQFASGLLFALPLLTQDSVICFKTPLESAPYLDLTLQLLQDFGIRAAWYNKSKLLVPGRQQFKAPPALQPEGDWSAAAFFLAAGALSGSVGVQGLSLASRQGDKAIVPLLQSLGARVLLTAGRVAVSQAPLKAFTADVSDIPDLFPILSVLAAAAEGTSILYGARRLRFKECDRLAAMACELAKLGVHVIEKKDRLILRGRPVFTGGPVCVYNDHRIAMALAIASCRCTKPLIIDNSLAVSKSFPLFYQELQNIGGQIL